MSQSTQLRQELKINPRLYQAMDLLYIGLLVRNVRRRPPAEILETAALMTLSVTVIVAAALTGHLWTLALIYLIPERAAMFVLAWWFDWLPHHDLEDTQRENRYRATRNRVGSEWTLTPLLLSQNYHLVHHLHPSIPFYRYVAAWRRNEAATEPATTRPGPSPIPWCIRQSSPAATP